MITLKGICRSFEKPVLKNLNLTLKPGNVYIIKGKSGCGKTTLLNILAGLDTGYEGTYLYDGVDVRKMNRKQKQWFREEIGYICQESLLLGHLNGLENLQFICHNDPELLHYAQLLGVDELLTKYPNQLSGGQRQRIAVVRALLGGTKVIIADEPSASLDMENAGNMVKLFEKIKTQNKIIIISTHQDIYDTIADGILDLKTGVFTDPKTEANKDTVEIQQEEGNAFQTEQPALPKKSRQEFMLRENMAYARKKTGKLSRFLIPVVLAVVIGMAFVVLTVKLNYRTQYLRQLSAERPYHVVDMKATEPDVTLKKELDANGIEEYHIYENYQVAGTAEGQEYCAYALFPWEDSSFKSEKTIAYGEFPQSDTEVLVSRLYAENILQAEGDAALGQEITVGGNTYTISGVVDPDANEAAGYAYTDNLYYPQQYGEAVQGNDIFIPYDSISQIGIITETEYGDTMVAFTNEIYLKDDYKTYFSMIGSSTYAYFNSILGNSIWEVIYFVDTLWIAAIVAGIIIVLFMTNQIKMDLFYRKRELGYLQIFHISRKRVWFIVMWQYLRNVLLGIGLAWVVFYIGTAIYWGVSGLNLCLNPLYTLGVSAAVIAYAFFLVMLPVRRYMKKDVIWLIK